MPTARTGDVETYYERRGDGPPVVFVHGAVLDHSQWDRQVEALSAAYETVTYDVRGHGRTGGSPRRSYSFDLLAGDLRALIDALDLGRPVLVGHSMGGCIAQTYAARWPETLSGLVLADTFTPELFSRREWLQRSVLPRAAVPLARIVGYERVERGIVGLHERLHGEAVSGDYGAVQQIHAQGPTMATAEFVKLIRALARFHEVDLDLGGIAVPTLVLYGEHEPPFVRQHAAKLGAILPDATVQVIDDAGHNSPLDEPAAVTGALGEFLAGVHQAGVTG